MMRILVIDDEDDVRKVVRTALERVGGMSVFEAHGGAEGVAKAIASKPDAILLDMMMPELDGAATYRMLRSEPAIAEIPVVFLTAKAMSSEVKRMKSLGAVGVILKPFDPLTLADGLRAILESHDAPVGSS